MLNNKLHLFLLLLPICLFTAAQSTKIEGNLQYKSSTIKNSVLSQGTWHKFMVDTTGVFRLDRSFLQNLGINTDEINPKNIRIFGNGGELLPTTNNKFRYDGLQENAILVNGEDDNSFDSNDFVLFYAKGPHGWNTESLQEDQIEHVNNIYSDKAYYFLTVDNGAGKRISNNTPVTSPESLLVTTFNDYLVFEEDEVNLFANGQQWLGENLSTNNTTTVNFNFSNIEPSKNVFVRVRGVTESFTTSS